MQSTIQSIKDIKQFQKPHDSIFSTLITRKFSAVFTYFALRVSWLTPNIVSTASFIMALGAVWLFLQPDFYLRVIGVVLLQASFVLDCSDGEIARARGLSSKFGAFLDSSYDRLKEAAMYLALTWIAFQDRETEFILWVGVAGLLGLQIISFLREAKKSSWPDRRSSEIYITKTIYLGTVDIIIFAVSAAILFQVEAELLLLTALGVLPLIVKQFFSAWDIERKG